MTYGEVIVCPSCKQQFVFSKGIEVTWHCPKCDAKLAIRTNKDVPIQK